MALHMSVGLLFRAITRRLSWLPAAAVLLTVSCQEHLPSYADPQDLFRPILRHRFVYSQTETVVYVSLVLVNQFDETLEGPSTIDGTLTVTIGREASTVRTYSLTGSTITYAKSYHPASGILRVDPGDSLVFQVRYDFVDNGGRALIGSVVPIYPDANCSQRMISEREAYVVNSSVKIFPRSTATVSAPFAFQICVPVPWVSDKVCLTPMSIYDPALCP